MGDRLYLGGGGGVVKSDGKKDRAANNDQLMPPMTVGEYRKAIGNAVLQGATIAVKNLGPSLKPPPKKRGAPSRKSFYDTDEKRAFHCWRIAQMFPEEMRASLTIKELIAVNQSIEAYINSGLSSHSDGVKPLFPHNSGRSIENSVSRGRRKMKIGDSWESEYVNNAVRWMESHK